ncbi:uncharacterized protein LOC132783682 isoform X2 [Drosophila nasuta]|uniref:Uncharacterized protein LOC117563253 isoform X2 n=1 Tax=Drosophila albomicans TaxID=7291 RepID=A0A6P8WI96_DROAB|nr:uncharacterized protein LOC117563253 isoform X2 [Drosophila albomicans]XP_060645004.1 uncharacterized protein LOC132783682 isoform X2 [Drosophila nasuta]
MKTLIILLVALLSLTQTHSQDVNGEHAFDDDGNDAHNAMATENRVAAQVEALLEHFKQEDPVGLPSSAVEVADPMDCPNVAKSIGVGTLNMMELKAYGLSKFRITSINMDLKDMLVTGHVTLDEMVVKGRYKLAALFSNSNGPCSITLRRVHFTALATLAAQSDGRLAVDQMKTDITFGEMSMDFQNLGFMGSMFQGVLNSAPNLVFDAMKPFMLSDVEKQLSAEIDKFVVEKLGDPRMPNSIRPLDTMIAQTRKQVREYGFDPYHLPDMNRTMGVLSAQLTNTWIRGVSSFYRVGNVTVALVNNTITMRFQVGTQELSGAGQWEVGMGMMSRIGHVQFTVHHLRATLEFSQALDTRQRPLIKDLQLDLGNIQVRCSGAGTLDYVMEFAVNVLPNLLRYQIMDAIENPIKQRVQETLNTIDIEQAIKQWIAKHPTDENSKISFDIKPMLDELKKTM